MNLRLPGFAKVKRFLGALAAIAIASPSAAGPPRERPYGDCTKEQHSRLNAAVSEACKTGDMRACTSHDSCEQLLAKVTGFHGCIEARQAIMRICYKGGDDDHLRTVDQLMNGLRNCTGLAVQKHCAEDESEPEVCDSP